MALIVEQAGRKLPDELVRSAAFVKYVDFDPVHQTQTAAGPAEKVKLPQYDTISISPEALAKAIPIDSGAGKTVDTIRLFRERSAMWARNFQKHDPEAWQTWQKKSGK